MHTATIAKWSGRPCASFPFSVDFENNSICSSFISMFFWFGLFQLQILDQKAKYVLQVEILIWTTKSWFLHEILKIIGNSLKLKKTLGIVWKKVFHPSALTHGWVNSWILALDNAPGPDWQRSGGPTANTWGPIYNDAGPNWAKSMSVTLGLGRHQSRIGPFK